MCSTPEDFCTINLQPQQVCKLQAWRYMAGKIWNWCLRSSWVRAACSILLYFTFIPWHCRSRTAHWLQNIRLAALSSVLECHTWKFIFFMNCNWNTLHPQPHSKLDCNHIILPSLPLFLSTSQTKKQVSSIGMKTITQITENLKMPQTSGRKSNWSCQVLLKRATWTSSGFMNWDT